MMDGHNGGTEKDLRTLTEEWNMLMMQLLDIILVLFLHYPSISACFAVRIMPSSMLCSLRKYHAICKKKLCNQVRTTFLVPIFFWQNKRFGPSTLP